MSPPAEPPGASSSGASAPDARPPGTAEARAPTPLGLLGPPAGRLALALAVGAAGGWTFDRLGLPLPWMLGAVCFSLAAALAGAPMAVPNGFRNGMLLVLGVLIGSGFTPDILAHVHQWAVSISLVLVYTVALTFGGAWFFRHAGGYSRLDAFFAGLPGGLAAVVFIGAEVGADLRRLSIVHSVRIVLVCFTIPFWIRLAEGVGVGAVQRSLTAWMPPGDALLLAACGIVGYFLARRLRLAAPFLLGPLILSGAVHLAGLTAAKPPGLLIVAAQVVVGSAIGCRFVGVALRRVLGTVGLGLASAALMVATAFAAAWGVHALTGLPYNAVLLALAPGGLPEMTLIALSLHIDLALVVSHHLVRVLFINIGVPLLYRLLFGRGGAAAPPPAPPDD